MSPWCDWGTGCEGPQGMCVSCGTGQGSRWSLTTWGVREVKSVLARGPAHRDVPQGTSLAFFSLEVTTGPLRMGGRTEGNMEGSHWHCYKTWVGFPGTIIQERESGEDGTAWGNRVQNKGPSGVFRVSVNKGTLWGSPAGTGQRWVMGAGLEQIPQRGPQECRGDECSGAQQGEPRGSYTGKAVS